MGACSPFDAFSRAATFQALKSVTPSPVSTLAVGTGLHVSSGADHRTPEAGACRARARQGRGTTCPSGCRRGKLAARGASPRRPALWLVHEHQRRPAPRPVRVAQRRRALGSVRSLSVGFGRIRFGRSRAAAGNLRPEGGLWNPHISAHRLASEGEPCTLSLGGSLWAIGKPAAYPQAQDSAAEGTGESGDTRPFRPTPTPSDAARRHAI